MVASGFSFSQDYKTAAYRAALDNQYGEIYTTSVTPWRARKLTAMGEQLKGFTLANREVVSWKSGDGTTIEGVLYTPPDFDVRKKYPLLVVIHGGPTGTDQPVLNADRYYPIEDRKSTRLNSSHVAISYAVFCFKKKISKDRERCNCLNPNDFDRTLAYTTSLNAYT